MLSDKKTQAISNNLDIISIGSIYQRSGNISLSENFYKLGMEKGIPQELDCKILRNYACVLKKQNNWKEALKFLEMAANRNDPESCIEIAKYYEHHDLNYHKALYWVELARNMVMNGSVDIILIEKLDHRIKRIKSKIKT